MDSLTYGPMTLGTIDMIEDMVYAAAIQQHGKKTCVQDDHYRRKLLSVIIHLSE